MGQDPKLRNHARGKVRNEFFQLQHVGTCSRVGECGFQIADFNSQFSFRCGYA
jgi:hypothetical protein